MITVPAMALVAAAVACEGVLRVRLVVAGVDPVVGGSDYRWRDLVEAFTFASVCRDGRGSSLLLCGGPGVGVGAVVGSDDPGECDQLRRQ